MRHLFLINPAACLVRSRVSKIRDEILRFFKEYPYVKYDIYVSEWCRDSVTYIRRYIMDIRSRSDEVVRVHTIGGTGTLFEVVNGVIGLDGVEIAAYPYGRTNVFLKYFKPFGLKPFASIDKQVFGKAVTIDAIRCGNNHGICFGIAGFEAYCAAKGDEMIERGLPVDLGFMITAVSSIMSKEGRGIQTYHVEVDGRKIDGEFFSIFIANTPCYGKKMHPGIESHPDDGKLEIYMHERIRRPEMLSRALPYLKGEHSKVKSIIHISGQRVKLYSDKVMCLNIDSETFYGTSVEYKIVPGAIKFVCPDGVELSALPRLYNKPEEGLRNV